MKTLIVALGSPIDTANRCAAALQVADACWNHFEDLWIICSTKGVDWWVERLRGIADDPSFHFMVLEVKVKHVDGNMPMGFYEWIQENKI